MMTLKRRIKSIVKKARAATVRTPVKTEAGAFHKILQDADLHGFGKFIEPNRADTPVLHIGKSGERYSTVTGVWWLDDRYIISAHRSGLRIAVHDTEDMSRPLWISPVDHLSDDIAATRLDDDTWEVALSGCWECIYTRYQLQRLTGQDEAFKLTLLDRVESPSRDFSHGVSYGADKTLFYSLHTGKDPRFAIGEKVYRLPEPWGVRDSCDDPAGRRHLAIAVSANPRKESYDGIATTIWQKPYVSNRWVCLGRYDGIHSDCIDVHDGRLWIPDQLADRLVALDSSSGDVIASFSGKAFDFPHGIAISDKGKIAVTNYGSSSIAIMDTETLLQPASA